MTDIREKILTNSLFTGELKLAKTFEIDSTRLNESKFINEKNKIMTDVMHYIGYEYGMSKCDVFIERMNNAYFNLFRIDRNIDKYEIKQTKTEFGELNIDLCLRMVFKHLYKNFDLSAFGNWNAESTMIYDILYNTAKGVNKSKADFVLNVIIRIVNMEFFNANYDNLFNTKHRSLPSSMPFKQLALELSLVVDILKDKNKSFNATELYRECNNLGEYAFKLREELIKIIKDKINPEFYSTTVHRTASLEVLKSIINLLNYELIHLDLTMDYTPDDVKNVFTKNITLINQFINKDITEECEKLKMLLSGKDVNKYEASKEIRFVAEKYLF